MANIWQWAVRLRNYIITVVGMLVLVLPDILSAPELLAVIPENWHKWVFLITMLLNLAVRWRPAAIGREARARR